VTCDRNLFVVPEDLCFIQVHTIYSGSLTSSVYLEWHQRCRNGI